MAGVRLRTLAEVREAMAVGCQQGVRVGRERIRIRPLAAGAQPFAQIVQRLPKRRPGGEVAGHEHPRVAVVEAQRFGDPGRVAGEVVQADARAGGAQIGGDPLGKLAAVERLRPQRLQGAVGGRQVAERNGRAVRRRRQAVRKEDAPRLVVHGEAARHRRDQQRGVPMRRQAGGRQRAGGFHDVRPFPTAEPLQRQRHAFHMAGHGDGKRSVDVGVSLHARPVEDFCAP